MRKFIVVVFLQLNCATIFFSRFQIIMKCVSIWPLDPALFSAR